MKAKSTVLSVFAVLLFSTMIAVSEPATEPEVSLEKPNIDPFPDTIKIWEAYAKGWVHITTEYLGQNPALFRVTNNGNLKVNINEMTMLLSPHPLQGGNPQTTQDGALTTAIVDANSFLDFYYGELTVPPGSYVGEKAWWCTEANEYTQGHATIMLGGEIMPDVLQEFTKNPDYNTNSNIWNHLYQHPTLVVGKTPLWKSVEDAIVHNIGITLAVTNIAVFPGPGMTVQPHARDSIIEDIIPKGYSYVPGSIVPAPQSVVENPDGTTTITWKVDIDAADVTHKDDPYSPTPYNTKFLRYTLVTPKLYQGRYFLPRADADVNHDGDIDSHSARPLLEVYRVNKPPKPNAGGPYLVDEGTTTILDASGSSDPNGDSLTYRWDLNDDGLWDTGWSGSPFAAIICPDGFYATDIVVEVSDGELSDTDEAHYTCRNVNPAIDSISVQPTVVTEGLTFTVHVTFSDPGWLDTHSAFMDWGDGQTSTPIVTEENDEPDATGYFEASHVFGDDFSPVVEITVTDDDGGADTVELPLSVLNVAPAIEGFTYAITVLEPRTQGYWRHQCNITEPYGDHTGITDDLIQFISSNSHLFDYVSTADDICTVLEWATGEEIHLRAQGQLMATWLNIASGKLEFSTGLRPPGQNETTLGDFLAWAESVIMSSSDWTELEYVKDVADNINNGNSIAIGDVSLSADFTDPGSDDITVSIDWGDATSYAETSYNDGTGPDPPNSPYGTYPFSMHIEANHSYWAEGSYDVVITVSDDDGGETLVHLTLDIFAP